MSSSNKLLNQNYNFMKKLNLFLIITISVVLLFGCGGSNENKTSPIADEDITKQEKEQIQKLKNENDPESISLQFSIGNDSFELNPNNIKTTIIPLAGYYKEDKYSLIWASGACNQNSENELTLEIMIGGEIKNGTNKATEISLGVSEPGDHTRNHIYNLRATNLNVNISGLNPVNTSMQIIRYSLNADFEGTMKSTRRDGQEHKVKFNYSVQY